MTTYQTLKHKVALWPLSEIGNHVNNWGDKSGLSPCLFIQMAALMASFHMWKLPMPCVLTHSNRVLMRHAISNKSFWTVCWKHARWSPGRVSNLDSSDHRVFVFGANCVHRDLFLSPCSDFYYRIMSVFNAVLVRAPKIQLGQLVVWWLESCPWVWTPGLL